MYRLAYNGDVVAFKMGRRQGKRVGGSAYWRLRRRVFATCGTLGTRSRTRSRAIRGSTSDDRVGCSASDGRCAPARPALDVSTCLCRFCHAHSRVPMVFGPFHYCAFCERAAPDAPETIDDQRRCTGCRYRTIYGGSRGSASLPRRRSGSVLVYDLTDSLRTRLNCMAPRSMAALISSGRIGLLR